MECEGPRNVYGLNFQELLLKHCFNQKKKKSVFFGISSFVMSFNSVTTDSKTWGKKHLLEYMSLYFGPSTVFLDNSKIFGWQFIKHLRPQSSATTTFSIFFFTPKSMMSFSIFSYFLFFFTKMFADTIVHIITPPWNGSDSNVSWR